MNLKPKKPNDGHPRYETPPGKQGQVDWKEDINLISKAGKKPTEAISKLSKEFGFRIQFCRARKPETKGSVEARNKIIDWLRAYNGEFETIEELIEITDRVNKQMNITINDSTGMSPTALFYKEKEYLTPLPRKQIIDSVLCPNRYKVYNDSMILYGGCRYSVKPELIGEEVTADVLENKLYIYYSGKLVTIHSLNGKPLNYKVEHYTDLMRGKVKEADMEETVLNNLSMMDRLLDERHIEISPVQACASAEAMIAYLNQSPYGKWIINTYAHLSDSDKLTFVNGMKNTLLYVKNTESFVSQIKFSLKDNLCRTLDFDCWVNDFMATSEREHILTEEGYNVLKQKYSAELKQLIDDISEQRENELKKAGGKK